MKKSMICGLVFIFAVGLVGIFLTGEASAQIRPAYTKNVDEPGRIPYQHMVEFNTSPPTCPLSIFCIVSFPVVPAGKRLVVEEITALMGVVSTGQANYLAFGDGIVTNSGNVAVVAPTFVMTGSAIGGTNFWSIDRQVHVYYEPGATPKVKIGASANFTFVGNMSLHGYLIDANN